MNQQEELILKILSSVDAIKGKTKFVKILHLVCKLLEKNKIDSPFQFKASQYGVYPVGLEQILEKMEKENYIHVNTDPSSSRQDLSAINKIRTDFSSTITAINPAIETLVQTLNPYSSEQVIAISYHFFPETTVNSTIKPIINKKITELFSPLSQEYDETVEEETLAIPISEIKPLYPRFNDLDARIHLMKSIGLEELPAIIPSIIDDSTGFIAKKYPLFKKYNLEEMLEDARRR